MTNAEARFNIALRPRKPEGSLGRTAQDGHLDSHTAPKLCCECDYSLVSSVVAHMGSRRSLEVEGCRFQLNMHVSLLLSVTGAPCR